MTDEVKPARQRPTELRSIQSFDNARLEYEVAGSGPPLVMLHGVLAGRRTFSRQLVSLSERFRLVIPSARGHDGSDMKLPPTYGAGSSDVDDLVAVLKAEHANRVSLLGHSSGGATAFVFACRHPDRVERMILIEPSLFGILLPAEREYYLPPFETILAAATSKGPIAALCETLALAGESWAKLDSDEKASRIRALSPMAPLLGPHLRSLLQLPATEADVRRVSPPTMLFYGTNSLPIHDAIAHRFRHLRPDLPLNTIEGAGHNVHRDRPDVFNSISLSFLK
jgi:pimeloyl-ACP methyl ester carboxylesterase